MMLPIEIAACLAAIAGSARLAAVEFTRARKHRQMTQALSRAVSAL
jgi:hypothetical protein